MEISCQGVFGRLGAMSGPASSETFLTAPPKIMFPNHQLGKLHGIISIGRVKAFARREVIDQINLPEGKIKEPNTSRHSVRYVMGTAMI